MTTAVTSERLQPQRVPYGLSLWWLAPVLLWLALVLPAHPDHFTFKDFLTVPLELPVLVLLALWTPPAWSRLCRWAIVLILVSLVLLRLADVGSYIAFDRAFSPLVELHLLGDGWNLASSTVGRTQATLVVGLLLLVLGFVVWIMNRSLAEWSCRENPGRWWSTVACVSAIALVLPALIVERALEKDWPVSASVPGEALWRIKAMRSSIADQTDFLMALQSDDVLDNYQPGFALLGGRDVLVLFVESYGRSFIDLEPMQTTALRRLALSDEVLSDAGLAVRSGWLEAPIRGGRSWLAHATFMSGLLVNNQARFDRLISSERQSLNRLFGDAGWHTVGLMPAIQFYWPEGRWYGFDEVLTSNDFNYRGEPFGWVTMPDQFTLSTLQRMREETDNALMAEVALISSHVPWTPIAKVVPWESIGDGRVFDGSQRDEPPIIWRDRPGVQALYNRALDYTLQVITEYVANYADDALIVVVGDHQPASIIDGWGKTADVPIHIISADASLLRRLPDKHFGDGMLPGEAQQSLPMQGFRGLISRLYESAE